MKYCSSCGNPVSLKIPAGDHRERHVCAACDTVHYQNPRIVTGCLPIHGERVLLCRRAIEPRLGFWTLPAGFLENGETTEQGAIRESLEEAQARLTSHGLYTLFNLPQINQVHFFYRASLDDLDFGPSPESLEVRLFAEQEIPWEQLAFWVVRRTLELYFADRPRGEFPFRTEALLKHPRDLWQPPS